MHQPNRLHAGRLRTLVVAPGLFVALAFASPGLSAQEATTTATTKVQPHSSKWDYPKEFNAPEGSKTHTVEKGDTLWDLSGKYLGNPYAWPQIWELNQWIKDPHWIYPGDPLIIDLSRAVATAGSIPEEVANLQPDQKRADPTVMRRPELGFSTQDFFQLPFVVPSSAEAFYKSQGAFSITSNKREDHQFLGDGETVYLNGGSNQGVKPGDRLLILKTVTRKLMHPTIKKKNLGDVLQQVGVLRVTLVQARGSVAVIERCMDTVQIGDHVVRFTEPANIPMQLRSDIAEPLKVQANSPIVVFSRDSKLSSAGGDMIIIDKGGNDGFKVGDVLLAVRVKTFSVGSDGDKKPPMDTTTYYLGQALVVRTDAQTATCRVLRSNEELRIGDTLTR